MFIILVGGLVLTGEIYMLKANLVNFYIYFVYIEIYASFKFGRAGDTN